MLGSDLAASGGSGELDPFNAGEALVNGVEMLVYTDLVENKKIKIPFSFSYTLTNATFLSDFGSTQDIWGVVSNGDSIPYIPKHHLSTTVSLQTNKFELNLNANYNGKFSTVADGTLSIPAYFILDASMMYRLSETVTLKSRVLNMLDECYAVSRAPAGLRPGHPFGVYAGFDVRF